MNLNPTYRELRVDQHNPGTGALERLTTKRLTNNNAAVVADPIQIDGGGVELFGQSRSLSVSVPGIRAGLSIDGTRVLQVHAELPPGLRLNVGWQAVFTADEQNTTGAVDVVTGLLRSGDLAEQLPYETGGNVDLDHNPTAQTAGILKMQLANPGGDVIADYNYQDDLGNTGYVILQLAVPYTEGEISGRAGETIPEGAGSGQTHVLVREFGTDLPFFQVGCHENSINRNFDYEYQITEKGFAKARIVNQRTKNLESLDGNFTVVSPRLMEILRGGTQDSDAYGRYVLPSNSDREFEVVFYTSTKSGLIHALHFPRATFKQNGSFAYGGDAMAIPFMIDGNEPPEDYFLNNLVQLVTVLVPIQVIP